MAGKRRPRAKRAPTPVRRLRPVDLSAQLRDAQDHAARHGEYLVDRVSLVLYRDMNAVEIWPDDPNVHAERAEGVAVLDAYYAML